MHWATLDPFLIDDPFWQQKMGMPVANEQFLHALLEHGDCASYRFFATDGAAAHRFAGLLQERFPGIADRVQVQPQATLSATVEAFPPDVIHNGDFTYYMPHLIEWRNRLSPSLRFPVTGVTHSLDTVGLYTKFILLLLAGPQPYDAIVCTSRCAVEMLRRSFDEIRESFRDRFGAVLPAPPRLVHIPLGLPARRRPLPPRTQARKRLGIPEDHVVLLSLGRLSPRSKMDLSPFLESFKVFLGSLEPGGGAMVTLVIAGGGRKESVRLVSEMVKALGLAGRVRVRANVSVEEKEDWLAASDLFCSLVDNYQETFGLSLLEAMEAGLPVIASDFNGYRDLVVDGETGFLVPTYASAGQEPWDALAGILEPSVLRYYRAQKVAFDMDALVKSLTLLVLKPRLRRFFSENARRRVEKFRWPRVIQAYRQLWKDLGSSARSESCHEPVARPVITPSVSKIFPHYPSVILAEASSVFPGPQGKDFARGVFRPIRYEETALLLRQEVLEAMVHRVSARGASNVVDLLYLAGNEYDLDRDASLLHLDWLIKHGVLVAKNR
ncbi:Glycosyltransferase involved in cell wall bisynthesis [Desulfacinum hydrothermale DSM 13146]|uniref:Glycosyltransferase involved in cell wall bisynthesis n=1 Tax=Desulfacinum hydrothermale DSM 13146 TaxID=1121390 RepID=A0A1W1XFR4_9BACT|nr:glycosyltransferase family 4 protein [Desulfacinum hydrothermale]SMC22438.1 Glycosyltransferase involved in cell wall bisynthesis [Desulfacinum hydrothermale DSM 13146]